MEAPMTLWFVARRGERRLEVEGDAAILSDLLRALREERDAPEKVARESEAVPLPGEVHDAQ